MIAAVLLLLLMPIWHQVHGHNIHLRALRVVRPGTHVPETEHERLHAARSTMRRSAANAAWLVFMTLIIVVALIYS